MSKSHPLKSHPHEDDQFSLLDTATQAVSLEDEDEGCHSGDGSPVKDPATITGAFIGKYIA